MIRFALPLPPTSLHPNARAHWSERMKANAKYRFDVAILAREHAPTVPLSRARLQLHFLKRSDKEPDDDNLNCWFKAGRDGLADAGIIANDRRFTMEPATWGMDKDDPRVVVTIEEIPDGASPVVVQLPTP